MADTGCWITNDGGRTYYNLNSGGGRAITFLQRIKSAPDATSYTYTISNKSANGSLFIIPITGGKVYQGGTSATPRGVGVSGIGISGNQVVINYSNKKLEGQGSIDSDPWFYFDVYQTIDAGDNYGLYFLNDLTSFSGITDAVTSGLCVYRTSVSVNGEWAVPTSIEGYANCSVFANWDHASAVVEFDSSTKVVTVTGGPITLNIAVFSNGFTLRMPDSGLYIFNSAGVCTFNSLYIPLFVKGSLSLTDTWQATGLAKPMVPLCVSGIGFSKLSGSMIQIFNKGIMMSGQSIAAGRGKNTRQYDLGNYGITFPSSSIPLSLIDGSQYFQ
ncbi:DUF6453 family protein [Erwinia papayae]|uniref:DUF6453 family protein n=1 Tax=Erwinia papayae TaxID=206499 RepID=A0ABV3N377_9GAMM